jgi:Beta-propeller repeat
MTKDRLSGRRDLRGALAALLCVVSTSAMASEWIRQLGTAKDDYANAVATDADRNVYVAGSSGLRTGAEDAWLTKLGPGGRVHWKRQLRTSETDRATGVATDADGKVYVAGWTTGSLGGTHQRNRRCMARQIRRCGKHALDQTIQRLAGLVLYGCRGDDHRDGNVYIAGNSSEDTPASTRGWVRKYDRRGNQLGGEFAALPSPDVATDADDNVYTAAEDFYNGEWNVAKHSPQGKLVWSRDYIWNVDSPFNTTPSGVAADSGGNAYVTGSTPGPFGGPLRGGYDAWLTKWDRNGRELWRRQFGTAGYDLPRRLRPMVAGISISQVPPMVRSEAGIGEAATRGSRSMTGPGRCCGKSNWARADRKKAAPSRPILMATSMSRARPRARCAAPTVVARMPLWRSSPPAESAGWAPEQLARKMTTCL